MNQDTAALVLTNLRERAEESDSPVVLTSVEIRALQILFGEAAADSASHRRGSDDGLQDTEPPRISPEQPLRWKPDKAPRTDLILCLDFGTSFSKASACKDHELNDVPELINISFGEDHDDPSRFFLPSELFIHDDLIYFGRAARKKFEIVEADQDRLIDSPKQYMTLGTEVADLHQKPLRPEQDASQSLSQRDALVLYLSHLNHLSENSLQSGDSAADVKRRYAHPGWDDTTTGANSKAMARIMAESIMLAKCFPREFEESMPLVVAQDIARRARDSGDDDLPFELLVDPVLEATAAGAGALMATRESKRQSYVILDIGAGTTDVAGCLCVNNPNGKYVKVAEVTGARKAIRRAGNNVDSILLSEILDRSSLARGTMEYNQVSRALRKMIRDYKETLFNDGALPAELTSGEIVEIELTEFLELESVKKLFEDIKEIVTDAAFVVLGDDGPVHLVATGGGATLPVVRDLVDSPIEKNGSRLKLRLRDSMPDDLRDAYPRLANVYPQLAVSVGGSHPELPMQISSITEGIRDPGPTTLGPVYR